MKHTILPLAIIATAMFTACNNGAGPKNTTRSNFTIPTKPAQQPGQFATNTTTLPGATNQPVATTTQTVPITTQAITPTPGVTSRAGLNPEHGQPGHRCDIAVGAPLDSKPATTPAITSTAPNTTPVNITPSRADVQKTFTIPTNTKATTASTSKAGINPAHGQPGHRCDIPVGAPLDSKPATPAVTSTSTNNTPVTTSSIPPFTQIAPNTTKGSSTTTIPVKTDAVVTAPGMNPEHGKPGHRCDIAVGAPLDSKPAAATVTEKKD